jgi:hypothetical protein
MDMTSTLIIRFRDLITAPEETISEHRRIIAERDFVWWGWWRRRHELVPTEYLSGLLLRVPLQIYLFDSGTDQSVVHLYPATLVSVAITPTGREIASPNINHTPAYYNNARYQVWLKLKDIALDPAPASGVTLRALPTRSDQDEEEFRQVLNQPVLNSKALRNIDVTLWDADIQM